MDRDMAENCFHTDEQRDVLHSLRHAAVCMKAASSHPEMWKWSVIAMHNAVQGAMVCHLSGTMQLGALMEGLGEEWHAFLQHDRDHTLKEPSTKLAAVWVLFERVTSGKQVHKRGLKKGQEISWVNDSRQEPLNVQEDVKTAFKALINLRNNLVHFTPRGWSIETSGLPVMFARRARFIARIEAAGWAFRHLEASERDALNTMLCDMMSLS